MKHNLKHILKAKGITQKELARLVEMTEVGISKLMRKGEAPVSTLEKISSALNLRLEDIVENEVVLHTKYEGVLRIGDILLDVAVLENGSRIIKQAAVFKAFNRPARGNSRVIGVPTFMDASNLQVYVDEQVRGVIKKVYYLDLKGNKQQGYDCQILPVVCELYLAARADGVLAPNQIDTACKAEVLVRSLAKVGIVALVDEATGYDKDKSRAKEELQKFLDTILAKEASRWVKTFGDDFFEMIYKMRGWTWTTANHRPGVVGKWINDIVYERLAPSVLSSLRYKNPKNENGNRTYRHHQFLSEKEGYPLLKEHIAGVMAIGRISSNKWEVFMRNLDKAYPKQYQQMELDFDE